MPQMGKLLTFREPLAFIQMYVIAAVYTTKDENFANTQENQIPSGHFILSQPDKVAQLWGIRTQNFTMNYDKFARAMRHYYANLKINSNDGVIRKVNGANYTYQFTKFNEYLYSIETGSRTNRLYTGSADRDIVRWGKWPKYLVFGPAQPGRKNK